MKDKKKLIILSSIILGVLVLTLGLTYAAFTYNKTGETSELVLGDIYMKYTENNQLTLSDAMPTNINKYITYKVNPVMATQDATDNELSRCINFWELSGEISQILDEGSTIETFCQGTGTISGGKTIQDKIDHMSISEDFLNYGGQELLVTKVIIQQISEPKTYKVNNEMTDEEISKCITIFKDEWNWGLSNGDTWEGFCRGTGKRWGETFQSLVARGYFLFGEFNYLKENNIIVLESGNKLPYFEFTISGKNTYEKEDIWYDIVLSYGNNHETRTTRIRDDLLRFSLAKVEGESETLLFNNRSYESLNNKRIHVETINANTMDVVNKTYRLYMWIGEDTVIGNVNQDYTLKEWADVFASIKVGVNGDFVEKVIYTDESCFTTEVRNTYTHNTNMTDEEINKCVTYLTNQWGVEEIGNTVDEGETYEDFCRGTGTNLGETFQTILDNIRFSDEDLTYFEENNVIVNNGESLAITDYDETCGSDVVIPKTIGGHNVTSLGDSSFGGDMFTAGKDLTSVVIPDSVVKIGKSAFYRNFLTKIEIPNSVRVIGDEAFADNYIEHIILGTNVNNIGYGAFSIEVVYSNAVNQIRKIINKSGKTFDWNTILNIDTEEENSFATGTIKYNSPSGEKEILVTSE